ncbi:MAG: SCE4755 family polysaccharide monooxygenase-like protein [Myxococcota bacterium]
MIALLSMVATSDAWAHEALETPIARYESDGFSANKSCPCGGSGNDQYCSVSTALSDPNRSTDRINEYAAGETITVRLHEVVGHSGRWRIAFDEDGADLQDFNGTILLDVPDPAGSDGNTGVGDTWEWQVTLPNVACETCTLQVIQVMNGDTVNPVPDPTGESSYFQCADLRLTAPADTGTPPTDPTTTGTGDTAAPTGTTTDTDTTDPTDPPIGTSSSSSTDDGGGEATHGTGTSSGCGCAGAPSPIGLGWIGAPMLLWIRRHRGRP